MDEEESASHCSQQQQQQLFVSNSSKEQDHEDGLGIEHTLSNSLSFLNVEGDIDIHIENDNEDDDNVSDPLVSLSSSVVSSSADSNSNSSNTSANNNHHIDDQNIDSMNINMDSENSQPRDPNFFDTSFFDNDGEQGDGVGDDNCNDSTKSDQRDTSSRNVSVDVVHNIPSDEHDRHNQQSQEEEEEEEAQEQQQEPAGMLHSVSFTTTNKSIEEKKQGQNNASTCTANNSHAHDDEDNKSLVSECTDAFSVTTHQTTSNISVANSMASYLNETDRSKERLRRLREKRFARESCERREERSYDNGNGDENGNDNDNADEGQIDTFMEKTDNNNVSPNAEIYDDCPEEGRENVNTATDFKNSISNSSPSTLKRSDEGESGSGSSNTNVNVNTPQNSPMKISSTPISTTSSPKSPSPKNIGTKTPPSSPALGAVASPPAGSGRIENSFFVASTPTRDAASSRSPSSPPTPSIQNSTLATTEDENVNNPMNSPCLSEINVQPMNSLLENVNTNANTNANTSEEADDRININDISQLETTGFDSGNDDDDDDYESANDNDNNINNNNDDANSASSSPSKSTSVNMSKATGMNTNTSMEGALTEMVNQTQELVDSIQKKPPSSPSSSRGVSLSSRQHHVEATSQGEKTPDSNTNDDEYVAASSGSDHNDHDNNNTVSNADTIDMEPNNNNDYFIEEEEKKDSSFDDGTGVATGAIANDDDIQKASHDDGPKPRTTSADLSIETEAMTSSQKQQQQYPQSQQPLMIPVLATQQEQQQQQQQLKASIQSTTTVLAGIPQEQINTMLQNPPLYTSTTNNNSSRINLAHLNQQEQIVYVGNGNPVVAHAHPSHHQLQFPTTAAAAAALSQQVPTRRSMKLRLQEEQKVWKEDLKKKKKFLVKYLPSVRRSKSVPGNDSVEHSGDEGYEKEKVVSEVDSHPQPIRIDRGVISISWYEGTTTVELQEHVRTSVERKLGIGSKKLLRNFRVIDETVQPNEEIVISSYIPSGSEFLCRFRIKDNSAHWKPHYNRAPDSPSAAPSPPGELERLQEQIKMIVESNKHSKSKLFIPNVHESSATRNGNAMIGPKSTGSPVGSDTVSAQNEQLSQRLEKLSETLLRLHEDGPYVRGEEEKVEKRQVIFMICNYFILFLSLIAISAEIHERAPRWIEWINENVTSVQNCAADRDALFECVSQGDFSGLLASIILWGTTSVSTKQLFLFGFDSPQKLWTVVYEAGVTAFCWGCSYMLIRRGLNPDTRPNFLHKYWKDAVYGSMAGFNAAFMKAVLKNLIPQEQMLDVLDQRQLRIVSFLGNILKGAQGQQ